MHKNTNPKVFKYNNKKICIYCIVLLKYVDRV